MSPWEAGTDLAVLQAEEENIIYGPEVSEATGLIIHKTPNPQSAHLWFLLSFQHFQCLGKHPEVLQFLIIITQWVFYNFSCRSRSRKDIIGCQLLQRCVWGCQLVLQIVNVYLAAN